eukprot:sb/3464857/
MLLLTLLLPSLALSLQCPCDTLPSQCDTNCCCDPLCTTDQLLSFTCPPFPLSDTQLCCQDTLIQDAETGTYSSQRTCSTSLTCLYLSRSIFTVLQNETGEETVAVEGWSGSGVSLVSTGSQYTNTDVLIAVDGATNASIPFLFPRQYFGDQCGMGPVLFYSETSAVCRRVGMDLTTLCAANTILDSATYLSSPLRPSPDSTTPLDLTSSTTFTCEDPATGAVSECTEAAPSLSAGVCKNAVKSVEIVLTIDNTTLTLVSASVTVTLTSTTKTELSQFFSVSYKPTVDALRKSGNFGYPTRSPLLSGVLVNASTIMMSSVPSQRPLALFSSQDCVVFNRREIEFGVGQYEGCRLSLEFYRYPVVKADSSKWCDKLKNVTDDAMNLPTGSVVGKRNRPTETSKQTIRTRYLGHVTGYQPIRNQYFLIRSVPGKGV